MATDPAGNGNLTTQDLAAAPPGPQPPAAGRVGVVSRFVGRIFGSAVSGAVGTAAGMATVDVLVPQLQPLVNREWSKHTDRPLSAVDAAALVERGVFTMDEAETEGALTGYNSRRMFLLDKLAGLAPAPQQLLEAFRRQVISAERMHEGLIQGNVRSEWADMFVKMSHYIPSVSNMVTFAVREAYSGGSELSGTTAELPGAFLEDAKRNGLQAADAAKYWASHWHLPSPTQMYQMLHRGLIDVQTVWDGLKASDYPPYWRDKLTEIAYLVPGRIDLRRMYAEGIIDEARVLRGYKELGYNDENAATLTDFAVEMAKPKPEGAAVKTDWSARARGLAFSDVHGWIKKGDINEAQAAGALSAIGIPTEQASASAGMWGAVLAVHEQEVAARLARLKAEQDARNPAPL